MAKRSGERGILKLEPKRVTVETRSVLTPQGSWDRGQVSPQPSVDRLSVTWAEPEGMATSSVNLYHLPPEAPGSSEVKFSPSAGDGSEDEDYSASLSAVLRQRRASVRKSRKGRTRRPSSPFLPDEPRARRRSSATTCSGSTEITIDEGQGVAVTQEQIFENIHLHKEVLGSVKQQPLGMMRKLKIVHQAKAYIKRHQGQLQERLAQSKSTRDIYARFNIVMATKWQQLKREAANLSNFMIPWELRIKEIESHFGSVVASYFTFLRWLFWVNLVIGFMLMVFVIIPEYLTAENIQDGERKSNFERDNSNATNLLTLWEFEGVLKCTPIFYGYYTNIERPKYRIPLAYFLTGLVVYIYSFVATLRKMAENSRMSKLSEKDDECIFSWKLFTGWDFMIGNTETAHNRIASVILGFKEALLEEAEKKKDFRNWRTLSLRALVNICVLILLGVSAFAVIKVVSRSDDSPKVRSWWRENETTIVVTVITTTFPFFFEFLGFFEHYHPRKQLRLQLGRIMLLNLLNLYSLIFALFSKIEGMSRELDSLKPQIIFNATITPETALNISARLAMDLPITCSEINVSCLPCNIIRHNSIITKHSKNDTKTKKNDVINVLTKKIETEEITKRATVDANENAKAENLIAYNAYELDLERIYATIISIQSEIKDDDQKSSTQTADIATSTLKDNPTSTDKEYPDLKLFSNTDSSTSSTYKYNGYNSDYGIESYDNEDTSDANYYDSQMTTDTSSSYDEMSTDYTTEKSITDPYYESTSRRDSFTGTSIDQFSTTKEASDLTTDHTTIDLNTQHSEYTMETTTESIDVINNTYPFSNIDLTSVSYSTTVIDATSRTTLALINTSFANENDTKLVIYQTCPEISFNATICCNGTNVTQVFTIGNCSIIHKKCYKTVCKISLDNELLKKNQTDVDILYTDKDNRTMYYLTNSTKKKLLKLCWETMFGQELVKLTMMDLVFVLLGTLFMDFFRALFVRYMNRCWCWDLEKKFPEYGDFKIAENILHLINNQGMVWMGMFFSPGLVVINIVKLIIMMYLRSWAVMTCNVPHEVVFRVSKSNNFYLALLLTMLFLCVLPVGYTIVWVKPSWHCGPFSEYNKIYHILTNNVYKILPKTLNFALEYIASPAIVIPLLVLLILIIYYLTSLTNSLREANNDLKIQLRRERTEERRKMFQLADNRRRNGSSGTDNTPFARWKKALPSLPHCKSIDSDDRKTPGENQEVKKPAKKRGDFLAKIVSMALDKKSDVEMTSQTDREASPSPNNDDESDTAFHETLPKEILKIKDITIHGDMVNKRKKESNQSSEEHSDKTKRKASEFKEEEERSDDEFKKEDEHRNNRMKNKEHQTRSYKTQNSDSDERSDWKLSRKQTSESSSQSKQSDSISSVVVPVITISATESDDELLEAKKRRSKKQDKDKKGPIDKQESYPSSKPKVGSSELKSLQRQRSVESIDEHKSSNVDKYHN